MKSGHHHINEARYGYTVRCKARLQEKRIFVSKRTSGALAFACKIRDAILRAKPKPVHAKARSNTGLVGITETTSWKRGQGTPCFQVGWRENGKPKSRRIVYGAVRPRQAALNMAIKLRKEKTK